MHRSWSIIGVMWYVCKGCRCLSRIESKERPRQDSNLQSSDPKSDALSIRPRGPPIWYLQQNVTIYMGLRGLYLQFVVHNTVSFAQCCPPSCSTDHLFVPVKNKYIPPHRLGSLTLRVASVWAPQHHPGSSSSVVSKHADIPRTFADFWF